MAEGVQLGAAYGKVDIDTSGVRSGVASAQGALAGLQNSMNNVASSLASVGTKLSLGLTLPLVGVAKATIGAASGFEDSMSKIAGLTDTTAAEFDALRAGVLGMKDLPQTGKELADGLFFVVSAGFKGADALTVLHQSAKAAAAGLGETKTVADAVTSALNAYKLGVDQSARVTDVLTNAVVQGKMSADSLAPALGRILPIAAAAGVPIEQVAASLATMTRTGLSAEEATTSLRGILGALVAPGTQAKDALAAMGLSAEELNKTIKEKGLLNALQMLMERTGGNIEQLDAIIPNIRALTGVLATAGSQGEAYAQILDSMNNASGRTDRAFEVASKNWSFQVTMISKQIGGLRRIIGEELIAALQPTLEALGARLPAAIASVSTFLAGISPQTKQFAVNLLAVAAAAGPVVLAVAGVAKVVAALSSPIGLVVTAISALAAAWATDFGGIREITASAVAAVQVGIVNLRAAFAEGGLPGVAKLIRDSVTSWAQAFVAWIGPAIPPMLAKLNELAGQALAWITTQGTALLTQLGQWEWQFAAWVAPAIPPMLAALGNMVAQVGTWITTQAPVLLAQLGQWEWQFAAWVAPLIPPMLAELGNLATQLWTWITAQVGPLLTQLGTWGTQFVAWIGPMIPPFLAGMGQLAGQLWTWITAQAAPIVGQLGAWANAFLAWIPGATVSFLQQWPGMLNRFLDWIGQAAPPILLQLGQWALKFVEWIAPTIPKVILALAGIALALVTFVAETVLTLGIKLAEWGWAFVNWIGTDVLPKLPGELKRIIDSMGVWVTGTALPFVVTKGKEIGTSWIENMKNGINGNIESLKALLSAAWEEIKTGAVGAFEKMRDSIVDTFDGVISGIKEKLNKVIELINSAISSFNRLGGPQMPTIPQLALGTADWRGGLALVGERGPELVDIPARSRVIPATQTAGMLASGGATYNIDARGSMLSEAQILAVFQTALRSVGRAADVRSRA